MLRSGSPCTISRCRSKGQPKEDVAAAAPAMGAAGMDAAMWANYSLYSPYAYAGQVPLRCELRPVLLRGLLSNLGRELENRHTDALSKKSFSCSAPGTTYPDSREKIRLLRFLVCLIVFLFSFFPRCSSARSHH